MGSWAERAAGRADSENGPDGAVTVPERVGAAFRMMMQLRMLIAAFTLVLLPRDELSAASFLLVLLLVVQSWLLGRLWRRIVPHVAAHPLLFALDMLVAVVVFVISGSTAGPFFLSTVVTAALAGLLYSLHGMMAVAALQIAFYSLAYALTAPDGVPVTLQVLVGQPLYYPLAGFAGVALRRLLDDYGAQESARLRAEVNAAAADERARLAREMHDSLAKTLRGITMSATALPVWVARDPQRAAAEAKAIAEATEVASAEARSLITELRQDALVRPLGEVIAELAERWGAESGVQVHLDVDDGVDLPPSVRHELVAILGEALANIERHARTETVDLALKHDRGQVRLAVRDHGRGFSPPNLEALARDGHFGLIGLTERARRVGGSVTVESEPGTGTTVTFAISADASADQPAEVSGK